MKWGYEGRPWKQELIKIEPATGRAFTWTSKLDDLFVRVTGNHRRQQTRWNRSSQWRGQNSFFVPIIFCTKCDVSLSKIIRICRQVTNFSTHFSNYVGCFVLVCFIIYVLFLLCDRDILSSTIKNGRSHNFQLFCYVPILVKTCLSTNAGFVSFTMFKIIRPISFDVKSQCTVRHSF